MKRPGAFRMTRVQTGYQNKIFFRTPVAAFFTLIFPVLLLVVMGALFGTEEVDYLGVTVAQYYAPALAVFAAASATYTNIGVSTSYQRDEGVLRRVRGTPLPAWIFMLGKVLSATLVAVIAVVIMLAVGVVFFGLQIYARTLPAATVTFLVGVACFSALGLLVAAVAPSGPGATAITNATLLPLAFFSGVFILPSPDTPAWITAIGNLFPLKHFNEAFQAAFNPELTGYQFDWASIAYMALWTVVGLVLAVRLFRWDPRVASGRPRRTRRRAETEAA